MAQRVYARFSINRKGGMSVERYCYKILVPARYTDTQLKDGELFLRSPKVKFTEEELRLKLAQKLKLLPDNVVSVSQDDFELVALENVLAEPKQLDLFGREQNLLNEKVK